MTDDFHQRHEERLLAAIALTDELLDPTMDLEELRAEFRDARLCGDTDLRQRVDAEAAVRERAAAKLARLYALLRTAGQQESEELSASAADELRRVVQDEFSRRTERGGADNDNP